MRSVLVFAVVFATLQDLQCLQSTPNPRLNFFDIDLLRYAAETVPGNVVLSPASIKATLAMLLEGAGGSTASEIKRTLRLSHMTQEFRQELKVYLKALHANVSGSFLQSTNAVFVSKDLKVRKEYETIMENVYSTSISRLNLCDTGPATKVINDWVESETRGLIPSIIEEAHLSPSSEVIVANVLYFKSAWQHAFDPKMTHGECFYRDAVCRTVAMMELQAELNYAYMDDLRSHAVELPYQGNLYSLIVLVPEDREAGVALIRDLPYVGLSAISELMEPTDLVLSVPKFTIDYSEDLVASLKSTGIKTLFAPNANLSGIFEDSSPPITSIHQTVHLSVDEEGTVAAAATAGLIVPLIGSHVQLRVDRPFIFFIRDNKNGLTLFEGKIEEPTAFVEPNDVKVPESSTTERVKPQVAIVPPKPSDQVDPPNKTTSKPDVDPAETHQKLPTTSSVENGKPEIMKVPERSSIDFNGSEVAKVLPGALDYDGLKVNKGSDFSVSHVGANSQVIKGPDFIAEHDVAHSHVSKDSDFYAKHDRTRLHERKGTDFSTTHGGGDGPHSQVSKDPKTRANHRHTTKEPKNQFDFASIVKHYG